MRVRAPGAMVAVAALLAGCSGTANSDEGDNQAVAGTLTVVAAASLADVFEELGNRLEADHPGLDVQFSFGGSSGLAMQLLQGAPADVFASADEAQMTRITDEDIAGDPTVFAQNVLVIAVPPDDPGHVTGLPDFARDELDLAVCAPEVPCGAAAERLFDDLGVDARPDTYEEDVRAVLTKVELGEVDAGLVYRTDGLTAGDAVRVLDVPEAEAAPNRYPVAVLDDAPNPAAARAFVELLTSADGRRLLAEAGFAEP